MKVSATPMVRDRILSCFWALCLIIGVGYIVYDNIAPPNPAAGYPTEIPAGWDLRITCAASRAYSAGHDPYYVENLLDTGVTLPYVYAPIFLDFFAPVCTGPNPLDRIFKIAYPLAALAIILLLVEWKRGRARNLLITTTIILAGFSGFCWVIRTGNAALFIGLFLAIGMYFMRRGVDFSDSGGGLSLYDFIGAITLGFALSLKFIYAPILFALMLLPRTWRSKILLIGVALTALFLPIALSVVIYPDVFPTFIQSLLGQIPGQEAPIKEGCNPSLYCLTRSVARGGLHISNGIALMLLNIAVIGAVLGVFGYSLYRHAKPRLEGHRFTLQNFNRFLIDNSDFAYRITFFLMFIFMLLMERVKEYGYFPASILAVPILVELPFTASILVGCCAVLLPIVTNQPRLGGGGLLFNYDQVIAAATACLIVLYYLSAPPRLSLLSNPIRQGGGERWRDAG